MPGKGKSKQTKRVGSSWDVMWQVVLLLRCDLRPPEPCSQVAQGQGRKYQVQSCSRGTDLHMADKWDLIRKKSTEEKGERDEAYRRALGSWTLVLAERENCLSAKFVICPLAGSRNPFCNLWTYLNTSGTQTSVTSDPKYLVCWPLLPSVVCAAVGLWVPLGVHGQQLGASREGPLEFCQWNCQWPLGSELEVSKRDLKEMETGGSCIWHESSREGIKQQKLKTSL